VRRPLLVVLLLALALVAAAPTVALADDAPTLSVVGQGSAFVTPDTADVSAAVTHTARTAAAAREDVARRTRDLLAALDRLGVARADVQTTGVTISRELVKKRPRVRFTARASIGVHLTDVARVGPVIDALTAAGADDLNGPSFGFSNPSAGRPQAEQAALADARARADAAAAAVGMRVIGVRSINLDPGSAVTPFDRSAGASAGAAEPAPKTPTPVETGRQQVTASVAVVFAIGPA
jgi:uncharacterized protein YggE